MEAGTNVHLLNSCMVHAQYDFFSKWYYLVTDYYNSSTLVKLLEVLYKHTIAMFQNIFILVTLHVFIMIRTLVADKDYTGLLLLML